MNTPAHAVLNLLVLARGGPPQAQLVVTAGALLPDTPMFIFYFAQRLILRTPEDVIWSQSYYQTSWQNFFDFFNSAPLIGLGLVVALVTKMRLWVLFFCSMGLHILADFPLHHDDAHRHFFPFSDWRFESPLSYWDPRYHGVLITSLEALLVAVGCVVIFKCAPQRGSRVLILLLAGTYMSYFAFAWLVWG